MRAVSTLRLTEKERQTFLIALKRYGFENAASFLRACAHALIVHHQHHDQLELPYLSFQLQDPTDKER